MAHQNIEIEIKYPLLNPEDVENFLNQNAEVIHKNIYQKDVYFVPIHRDFLAVKHPYEWLRLRQSPKGASITYKHFYPENIPARETEYCNEFETNIESFESMEKILL